MSLLELEHVVRTCAHGVHRRAVLRDVSLRIDAGEMVTILGERRSGRSTLLRIACGIEPIDGGVVRFRGTNLRSRRARTLGEGIGYCSRAVHTMEGRLVLDELMAGQLARGIPAALSRQRAVDALQQVGAPHCAVRLLHDLDPAEAVRVSLARSLALSPALIVIDEPVKGVDLLERDEVLRVLRGIADSGVAVLMSAGEATALSGADRALVLADGLLRGSLAPELAQVLPLRRHAAG